ncbi:UNVERIFIED_CONTAM: hypothetical protein FKN15_057369 [Acipenser sinensis]
MRFFETDYLENWNLSLTSKTIHPIKGPELQPCPSDETSNQGPTVSDSAERGPTVSDCKRGPTVSDSAEQGSTQYNTAVSPNPSFTTSLIGWPRADTPEGAVILPRDCACCCGGALRHWRSCGRLGWNGLLGHIFANCCDASRALTERCSISSTAGPNVCPDCPDKRDKAEARQEKGDAGGGVAKDVVEQGEKGLPVPDPEPSQNVAGPAPQLALQTEKQTTECTVNEGEFTEVKSKKRNKSAAGLSDSVLERSPRAVCREVAELDTASSSKVVEHGGDLQTPLADGPESGPAAVLTCPEEKRESSLTAELPVPDSAEGMEQFVAAERIGEELKQVGRLRNCTELHNPLEVGHGPVYSVDIIKHTGTEDGHQTEL